jgi:tetratricopeptide (TPR) repeat protein
MRKLEKSWVKALLMAAAMIGVLAPGARAQGGGSISGTIIGIDGKPLFNLTVEAVSEQGAKSDATTDAGGTYTIRNLRPGVYVVTITKFPPPNDKQPAVKLGQLRVTSGEEAKADMNFKDEMTKQGAAAQEQVKKQNEEKQKFEGMKAHFAAGTAFLDQERKAKEDLTKATPDQRDAAKQNLKDLSDKAAEEFQAAQKTASEKDPNQHLLWAKLGESYDIAGRNDEAAQAYQQAINAKPDDPGYYNNLGNVLARAGKIDEARAAYTKSAELDPTKAALAWRNFGISLYSVQRMTEAIEPLKKATQLDPNNAQGWYLLATCMVADPAVYKQVGDKIQVTITPGTVEAYQKAIELDPNGPYGKQAQEGLTQLQQMAPGVDTKVNAKKKKS